MGSYSFSQDCPKCGGKDVLMCCEETRTPGISGECLKCGWNYWTEGEFLKLKSLNQLRTDFNLKPLTEKEFKIIKKDVSK